MLSRNALKVNADQEFLDKFINNLPDLADLDLERIYYLINVELRNREGE